MVADPDDWTEQLPDKYLLCRDLGHSWRPLNAAWDTSLNHYLRTMRCPRCGTERIQYLSGAGHVLSGHYLYADGYQAPKGSGRLTGEHRDHLRLESVLRLVNKETG